MSEHRVLIFAPLGRDGPLAQRALQGAGLEAEVCAGMDDLVAAMAAGAGAVVITGQALLLRGGASFATALQQQPPWSDLPVIVFGGGDETTFRLTGNLTLLDRPVRMRTLLSAVRAALRARKRQYQVRDLLEELEQSVRDRDQFLAMLGHELRNPLAAILVSSELLDRKAGDGFASERGVIKRQVRNLTRLVDDLLDVSRVTRGKIAIRKEPVDLHDLLQRVSLEFSEAARLHGVDLYVLPAAPVIISGDPLRLEQIIANLLSNAVKYTNPGGRITVGLEAEGDEAVLRVKDTGVGISAEMLPRVFDLFLQAPGAIDRAQGGMGIGLTLVQRLTALHSGKVEARSEGLGKGSEFVVRLPLSSREAGRATDATAPLASAPGLRLLLVEDNPDAREILKLALQEMGHEVAVCGDGSVAIERAVRDRPDAMLVDLGLPGCDGFEVARAVRGSLGTKIRLVAVTGYGQPSDRERALAAGFDAFLVKPAELAAVESALRAG
ncbi:MAG: hybrid sensor histidine kinase/response regulator [Deltaproteobacteria bacterium]|nr:MAG: hybrid sensor histidine kinase/response regulator [Deltaproteobacteria bacterium]